MENKNQQRYGRVWDKIDAECEAQAAAITRQSKNLGRNTAIGSRLIRSRRNTQSAAGTSKNILKMEELGII